MNLLAYAYPALTFLLSLLYSTSRESSLIVHLTSGLFEGASNGSVDIWLGIPFAQPPVGSLRFKAPVPITTPTSGVKVANQYGNVCPQLPSDSNGAPMSEDCLYLNVCRISCSIDLMTNKYVGLPACWYHCGRQTTRDRLFICQSHSLPLEYDLRA